MRTVVFSLVWAIIAAVVALPVIFRRSRFFRILAVLILLVTAVVGWGFVQTSARIATEKGHVLDAGPDNPFVQGALAARDAAREMGPFFWVAVLGLVLLALVPRGPEA